MMRTLKSRRAMLDTLMRHLDMVRLSAAATAALLLGCTGLISGDPTGGGSLTAEQQIAANKFKTDAYPLFSTVCAACHGGTDATIAFVQASTPETMRTKLLGWDPQVVNTDAPASSRVLTKGAHSGPALDATQTSAILGWIQAEKDAAGAGSGSVEITTAKFTPLLCTGGVANDVAGCSTGDPTHCCPVNIVKLDSAGLAGAEIDLVAQPLSSDLYISDLYLKAATDGAYLEHPLFVSWPSGASATPVPDTLDRFFAVKMNLAVATATPVCPGPSCDHIGAGAAAFVGFAPQNQLSITFKVLEGYHKDSTPPPPNVGCGTLGFPSFITNVKPMLATCMAMCHGGTNGGAKAALDMSGLASTTDNTTCLQIRSHVNFQSVATSGVLLAPQMGQDAAHPFKLSTTSTPTIANFQTALNTWITVEASEQ